MLETQQNGASVKAHRETWCGMTQQEVMLAEIRACLDHVMPEVKAALGGKFSAHVFAAMSQYATSFGRLAEVRIFAARTRKRRRVIRQIQRQQEVLLQALHEAVRNDLTRRLFGGTPVGSS